VLGLFLTMRCGKLVHGDQRLLAALVRYAVERRKVPRFGSE
jgi:hypothetical protein